MNKKVLKYIYIAVPSVILVLALAFFGTVFANGYFSSETVKNLEIGTIPAGGKTEAEITELLNGINESSQNIKIKWNEEEFDLNLNEAGVVLNVDKTVEAALNTGKDGIFNAFVSSFGKNRIPFSFSLDNSIFSESVNGVMTEKGLFLGNYKIETENGKAEIFINTSSGELDTEGLSKDILEKYPDVSEAFILSQGEFKWPDAESIRDEFNIEAVDAKKETVDGETKIIAHKEGREIDFEALKKAIDEKQTEFSVPYKTIAPKVYTEQLGDENFPDLLGKCVTKFSEGAVSRSTNVRLAASKINGYVMNKGDVFSFNGVVGKRTQAAGFKNAPVYTGSGVEDGVGGGICQVSSTLYGAVLEANLKIVSRTNHSYVVSYTKPGLDATVSYGTIDFKFSNPYNSPVKIKAEARGGQMVVYIYGTKESSNTISLGYEILETTPRGVKRVFNPDLKKGSEVVKTAGYDGMKVRNYKYIKDANGNIIKTENLGISRYVVLDKLIEYNDGNPPEEKAEEVQVDLPTEKPNEKAPEETSDNPTEEKEGIEDIEEFVPENPTQDTNELDPEISGNAGTTEEANPIDELEEIVE